MTGETIREARPLQGDKTLISIEHNRNNSCPLSIMPSLPLE